MKKIFLLCISLFIITNSCRIYLIKKIPNISKTEIDRIDKLTRELICNELRDKLLYLEKYSTKSIFEQISKDLEL